MVGTFLFVAFGAFYLNSTDRDQLHLSAQVTTPDNLRELGCEDVYEPICISVNKGELTAYSSCYAEKHYDDFLKLYSGECRIAGHDSDVKNSTEERDSSLETTTEAGTDTSINVSVNDGTSVEVVDLSAEHLAVAVRVLEMAEVDFKLAESKLQALVGGGANVAEGGDELLKMVASLIEKAGFEMRSASINSGDYDRFFDVMGNVDEASKHLNDFLNSANRLQEINPETDEIIGFNSSDQGVDASGGFGEDVIFGSGGSDTFNEDVDVQVGDFDNDSDIDLPEPTHSTSGIDQDDNVVVEGLRARQLLHVIGVALEDMQDEAESLALNGQSTPLQLNQATQLLESVYDQLNASGGALSASSIDQLEGQFTSLSEQYWNAVTVLNELSHQVEFIEGGKSVVIEVQQGLSKAKEMIEKVRVNGGDVSRLMKIYERAQLLLPDLRGAVASEDADLIDKILSELDGLSDAFFDQLKDFLGEEIVDEDGNPENNGFAGTLYETEVDQLVSSLNITDAVANELLDDIVENVEARIISKLQQNGLPASLLEDLVSLDVSDEFKTDIERALEFASDSEKSTELLQAKARTLRSISTLNEALERADGGVTPTDALLVINTLNNDLGSFDFTGDASVLIQEAMDEFSYVLEDNSVTAEEMRRLTLELKEKVETLREADIATEFENGDIPFLDADNRYWFRQYAEEAKELGLVKGENSEGLKLNPADLINLAEVVTLFGRLNVNDFTNDSSTQEVGITEYSILILESDVAKNLPEWAHESAGKLISLGVDLDGIFGDLSADDSVTRGQIAELVTAMTGFTTTQDVSFTDVSVTSPQRGAIAVVNTLGIMTGKSETTFAPNDSFTRAGATKVAVLTAKELDLLQ